MEKLEQAEQFFQEGLKLVEKSPGEALKLFRKAADLGHEKAFNNIRWMYQEGLVVFNEDLSQDYIDDVEKRQIPEAEEYIGQLIESVKKEAQRSAGDAQHLVLGVNWNNKMSGKLS